MSFFSLWNGKFELSDGFVQVFVAFLSHLQFLISLRTTLLYKLSFYVFFVLFGHWVLLYSQEVVHMFRSTPSLSSLCVGLEGAIVAEVSEELCYRYKRHMRSFSPLQ
jgi:hypothetical protein